MLRWTPRLLLVLSLFAGGFARAENSPSPSGLPFSSKEFVQLTELAQSLGNMARTHDAVIVTVGRSLSAVEAIVEAGRLAPLRSVPLSNFRYGTREQRPLTDEETRALFAHFDHFFPTDAELAGRKVIVADFVSAGDSLVATRRYLEAYLQQRGRRVPLLFAAPWRANELEKGPKGVELIPVDRSLIVTFSAQKWDKFSRFERFDLKDGKQALDILRDEFRTLVRALRSEFGIGGACNDDFGLLGL